MGAAKKRKRKGFVSKRLETVSEVKDEFKDYGHKYKMAREGRGEAYRAELKENWREEKGQIPILFFSGMLYVSLAAAAFIFAFIMLKENTEVTWGDFSTYLGVAAAMFVIRFLLIRMYESRSGDRQPRAARKIGKNFDFR